MTGRNMELTLVRQAAKDMPPYQRLLGDAMRGNAELFARQERKDTMSKEERFENRQWNDAIREAKRAYKQFSDFEWKVQKDEPIRAARHLRKSLDDFNSAMTHIAKADVGESQKGAVDDINRGIKELGNVVTALDNDNVDSAQKHYDKAATDFGKAADILG